MNAGRLSAGPDALSGASGGSSGGRTSGRSGAGSRLGAGGRKSQQLGGEAGLKAKVVRQRKEALKYSVERLELEVLQKERELRLRLDKA